ncbi:MAG: TraB/GumN family protein [Eubacteriales bacterium]|nr:TraB/GumN family protein [Eubacteriales bacterium]
MNENVTRIHYQDKEIILIPTAHVSKESVELVKQIVAEEKPDSICVELDEQRYQTLQNPKAWESTDIVKVIKSKKVGFLLANLILSSYQKRMAKRLNTNVGQEMVQGIKCAEETGAHLVLADRSIQVTFMRIWRKLNFWEKAKLIFNLVFSFATDEDVSEEELKQLMEGDMLESALSEMKKQFPKIGNILISERDQYLAAKIKNAPGPKVVAILGGAHLPGVRKNIDLEQDTDELTHIAPKKPTGKIVGWTITLLIVGLIVYGFITNTETGLKQISSWVLWNSVLAGGFTALAFAHPLSILTSFVVAPLSSLNPMLACGWFSGLVEASVRKPTVSDVNSIPEDIMHLKGFFKNRFLRILLVVVMANIGSSLGTFVAGLDMIRNLF